MFFQKGKFIELHEENALEHHGFDLKFRQRVKMGMAGLPE